MPDPPESSHPGLLGETCKEHVLEGRQDPEANKLLEPGILQLEGGVLQGRHVLPHHLDVLAVWLPEGLLKLQEDFIVGPKAYFPDRFRLFSGQWWLKEGVQMLLKKTWNSKLDALHHVSLLMGIHSHRNGPEPVRGSERGQRVRERSEGSEKGVWEPRRLPAGRSPDSQHSVEGQAGPENACHAGSGGPAPDRSAGQARACCLSGCPGLVCRNNETHRLHPEATGKVISV